MTTATPTPSEALTFPFRLAPLGAPPLVYDAARERADLTEITLPSGDRALLVTRYDDVQAVGHDRAFSRNLRFPGAPRMQADLDVSDDPDALVNMDGAEHTRLRRLVHAAFTPRGVRRWRPEARTVADALIDRMTADGGSADLMPAFAYPLPIQVICRLMGVPADADRYRAWSEATMSINPLTTDERIMAILDFTAHIEQLVAEHRREPGEGLVDDLIAARDGKDALSEGELVWLVRSLVIAGHETTSATIGRGLVTLLRHPEQLAELRADPGLVPKAVDEILRYDTPSIGGLLRLATERVQLPSGAVVEAGRAVLAPVAAANRDPLAFPDPHRFDIHRSGRPHAAFGTGPHYCLGASLARVELEVAFTALLERLPELRLAVPLDELRWQEGGMMNGLVELPVQW